MKRNRQVLNNYFGHRTYTPEEVLRDVSLRPLLKRVVSQVCRELGISASHTNRLIREMWSLPGRVADTQTSERILQDQFVRVVAEKRFKLSMRNRARRMVQQISPFLTGRSLLDVGCGDGLVCAGIADRFSEVMMVDVMNYVDKSVRLPFRLYKPSSPLPIRSRFDTALLLTVLHHARDPIDVLRRTIRATNRRIIIIESVFGVRRTRVIRRPSPSVLYSLSNVRQFKYASFIDWLYNRVFHNGVSVPYNYQSPRQWMRIATSLGAKVVEMVDLGIDQPIVPEHHYLIVLEPRRSSGS